MDGGIPTHHGGLGHSRRLDHVAYFDEGNLNGVRRALRIQALPPDWREWLEDVLAKAGTGSSDQGDCCGERAGRAGASV